MSEKKKDKKPGGPGVDLLDREKEKQKLKPPSKYQVVFYNDDYTPMDFVVIVLLDVFRQPAKKAIAIMYNIHENGRGIAGGPYSKEIAETKVKQVIQYARAAGHPLHAVAEKI